MQYYIVDRGPLVKKQPHPTGTHRGSGVWSHPPSQPLGRAQGVRGDPLWGGVRFGVHFFSAFRAENRRKWKKKLEANPASAGAPNFKRPNLGLSWVQTGSLNLSHLCPFLQLMMGVLQPPPPIPNYNIICSCFQMRGTCLGVLIGGILG